MEKKNIMAHCDNEAVVAIIDKGDSREEECMYLMWSLAFFRAKFNITLYAQHIKGSLNDLADALSCDRLHYFMTNYPHVQSQPTVLPPEPLNNQETRLDVTDLDRAVESYFRAGLVPSTQRSYDTGKRRFLQFCNKAQCKTLPVTEQLLCRYVSYLADQGLSPKSTKCYLSAVRHLQIANHMHDPKINEMSRLEQVTRGIKRKYAQKSPGMRVRLPITAKIQLKMRSIWEQKSQDFYAIILWVACCLCSFGFLWAGEITVPSDGIYDSGEHLNVSDISVDKISNPTTTKVRIKASKTDPFRQGVDLFVGKTDNKLCLVTAMMAYLAKEGQKEGM